MEYEPGRNGDENATPWDALQRIEIIKYLVSKIKP
jgi:hypothetical protein